MKTIAVVMSVLALVLLAAPSRADDVTAAIGAAESAYAAGNLVEAAARLEAALVGVNGQLLGRLAERLPVPPPQWTAGDVEGVGADATDLGSSNGLVVSRIYHAPNGSTIEVSISADSPLLGSLRMYVTNPGLASMAGRSGMRKIGVCGFDAVESSDERGVREISIIVGARTLVTVSGRDGKDAPHVQALAAVMDCQGIAAVVE
jgi:hypothetical protein